MSNPSLINSNPSHQSTGFAIGGNIVLNFSEEVVSKEGTIEIRKTSDNSSFESFDVTTNTRIAGSGTSTITIDPEKTLEESTSYYLYIPNEAFDDLSGASFSERVDKSTFLFTTEDLTSPTFSSAATNTAGTKVILTYDETLSTTTAATSAFEVITDGASNNVIDATVSGSTVELTLTTVVKNDEAVFVSYTEPSAGVVNRIEDSSGNDAVTLASTSVTNNSTVAGTPPTFSSASTNTAGTKVILTYNEALSATTAATSAFDVTTGGSSNSVTDATVSGSTVELTLTTTVKNDEAVTVAYTDPSGSDDANAIQDSSGNDVVDLASTSVTNNSTVAGTAPTISSLSPADDATAVATTSNIVLNFSEAVDVETGNIVIYKASDDSVVETIDVTSSQVTGTGSTQITINPSSDLAESTSYYVQIAATVFDDSSSNSYAGISDKTSLSFTTADETAPTITGPSGSEAGASTSSVSINENGTAVNTFEANETVTWSLNGGADASLFSINSSSGALSFSSAPDYEAPGDSDSGNDYVVGVRATDAASNTSDQTLTVKVIDVSEKSPATDGTKVAEVNSSYVADSKGFASITSSTPVTVTSYEIGKETTLDSIKDYDGNLHAGDNLAATASSYKYQGMLDVNGDGVFETIFTNKSSKRWVTAKVDSTTGQIDFDDNGAGGGTRVVGIYADPLIAEGADNGGYLSDGVTPAPANFGVSDADRYVVVNGETIDRLALNSQVRFQNDLEIDNLQAKHSGDYDEDGIHEVYWKTADGTAYLRSLMHADGNIRYANYQSLNQMVDYLTNNGDSSAISDIL